MCEGGSLSHGAQRYQGRRGLTTFPFLCEIHYEGGGKESGNNSARQCKTSITTEKLSPITRHYKTQQKKQESVKTKGENKQIHVGVIKSRGRGINRIMKAS